MYNSMYVLDSENKKVNYFIEVFEKLTLEEFYSLFDNPKFASVHGYMEMEELLDDDAEIDVGLN